MKQKNPSFDLLWNHLNTWGAIFVDCGFSFLFVGSNVNPVFSFKKSNLFEFFFFIKDVNLWRRSTDEYHESLATTNSNNASFFKKSKYLYEQNASKLFYCQKCNICHTKLRLFFLLHMNKLLSDLIL